MFNNTFLQLKQKNIDANLFDIYSRRADFDIFHLFGSNNAVSELYTSLSGQNKKLIVSAIDYSNLSYLKLKTLKYIQKIYPIENTYKHRQKLFDYSQVIIANSNSEKEFLLNYFEIDENKIEVVPVGVSSKFYNSNSNSFIKKFNIENYILCVGRINSRKAQIKTIKALKNLNVNLVFIGREDPSELDYFNKFQNLVKEFDNVHWIGQLDNGSDLLISAYTNALIHILPSSPPEFPGIASLEAGISGTKVVTTKAPSVTQTLGEFAFYCESNEESIYNTTMKALNSKSNDKLKEHLYNNFTWERVTDKIVDIYEKVYKEY